MTFFTVLILVCSATLDYAACRPDTAIDVVHGPRVASETACGTIGQTTLATTALAPRPGMEYVKIVCTRSGAPNTHKAAQTD